jgi:hypothetical protein
VSYQIHQKYHQEGAGLTSSKRLQRDYSHRRLEAVTDQSCLGRQFLGDLSDARTPVPFSGCVQAKEP